MAHQKLAIISDFHLDSNAFSIHERERFHKLLKKMEITDLHFAGDLSNDFHGLSQPFLTELSNDFSVTYNLGNHDMVNLSEQEIQESDFQVKWFGSTAFLSFHGWYDYSLMLPPTDPQKIEHFKQNFYFDRKIHREYDDIMTTQKILITLEHLLTDLSNAKRIIISMHFVPHRRFVINTRYEKLARFNAYLGSKYFHELFIQFPNISDVVFGHLHHRMSPTRIDAITYHARPLGYRYEWAMVNQFLEQFPHYQIPEMYHLRKRYNAIKTLPDWKNFCSQQLDDEFLSALTLFTFDSTQNL